MAFILPNFLSLEATSDLEWTVTIYGAPGSSWPICFSYVKPPIPIPLGDQHTIFYGTKNTGQEK